MRGAGYSVQQLKEMFRPKELRRAGYSVHELKGTFNDKELKKAGFSASELERKLYQASPIPGLYVWAVFRKLYIGIVQWLSGRAGAPHRVV